MAAFVMRSATFSNESWVYVASALTEALTVEMRLFVTGRSKLFSIRRANCSARKSSRNSTFSTPLRSARLAAVTISTTIPSIDNFVCPFLSSTAAIAAFREESGKLSMLTMRRADFLIWIFWSSEVLLNKFCSLVLFSKSCSSLYGSTPVSPLCDAGVAMRDIGDGMRDTDGDEYDAGVAHATPMPPSGVNSISPIPSKRGTVAIFARVGTGTMK
jgi:hypothetical protein